MSPLPWKGYILLDTYPKGPAAGRLFRDDVIIAVDGKMIGSPDMPEGIDPANGLAYGFGGVYNSSVTVRVRRLEAGVFKYLDIPLQRSTWSAEPTNCEKTPHTWDGTETLKEPLKMGDEPEKKSNGCSAGPATPPPRGPIDGLWDLGGDLGEWLYDVTH